MFLYELQEIYIDTCKPIPVIYTRSEENPDEIKPKWLFLFQIKSNSDLIDDNQKKCRMIGKVANSVIGFDAEVYSQIHDEFPLLVDFLKLYFEKSLFLADIEGRDIINLQLPQGRQLTFLKWLQLQPNFDYESFSTMLFDLMSTEYNDDEEFS